MKTVMMMNSNYLLKVVSYLLVGIIFSGCTTSTRFIVNPSSSYIFIDNDDILVSEVEGISAYQSQNFLIDAYSKNPACNVNYHYAAQYEKEILQWGIAMPIYSNVIIDEFDKIITHTKFDYLLVTKVLGAKSGETIYEGIGKVPVEYTAEEVTIGFKLYDLKSKLVVKDFVVISTQKPMQNKDDDMLVASILVNSPIRKAIGKGFKKITKESACN